MYCRIKYDADSLTIDHIIPRSRNGITTWENCVASCRSCNTLKADRTPQEAKMQLASVPKKPNHNYYFTRKIQADPIWKKFI